MGMATRGAMGEATREEADDTEYRDMGDDGGADGGGTYD